MNELWYFLVPLNAAIWMAGGRWNKNIRRLGYPILALTLLIVSKAALWQIVLIPILAHGSTRLPFTLKGHSVDTPIGFAWIWLWSAILLCPPLLAFSLTKLTFCIWAWPIIGSACTLSNLKFSKNSFQWKFCEFLTGALAITPYIITSMI